MKARYNLLEVLVIGTMTFIFGATMPFLAAPKSSGSTHFAAWKRGVNDGMDLVPGMVEIGKKVLADKTAGRLGDPEIAAYARGFGDGLDAMEEAIAATKAEVAAHPEKYP